MYLTILCGLLPCMILLGLITFYHLAPETWVEGGVGGWGVEGEGGGCATYYSIIFLNPLPPPRLGFHVIPLSVASEKLMILPPAIINAASLNRFTR